MSWCRAQALEKYQAGLLLTEKWKYARHDDPSDDCEAHRMLAVTLFTNMAIAHLEAMETFQVRANAQPWLFFPGSVCKCFIPLCLLGHVPASS